MAADRLVGRRLAIAATRSAIDAALGGTGGIVLLAGDAGMGKTALLTEAVAYAKAQGAATVWGTCWDGDGAPGYWPWIQVVRALDPDRAGAGGAGREILAWLTGQSETRDNLIGDEAAARFRAHDAMTAYLRTEAERRPLVVALDDLHWADISSLRLLAFIERQLHDAPALVIGTYRDVDVAVEGHPLRPLLAELASHAELLQLTGLTASEVGHLLQKVCGASPPPTLTQAVHDRTAGNPFFVLQIARLLAAQDSPLDRAPLTAIPPAVGDVLARRLARLPQDVVDTIAVASVAVAGAGRAFAVPTVAELVRRPPGDVARLIDEAVRAGIVELEPPDSARFVHDLFREVLYYGLPVDRRSRLHLAVAERIDQGNDPATASAEVAHHRAAALPLGDRYRAVTAFVTAGRQATRRLAFDEAAAQMRRAVDVAGGDSAVELSTLCEYAESLRRAGYREAAQATFGAAVARARASGEATAMARAAFGAHRVEAETDTARPEVIALLEEALTTTGEAAGGMRWLLSAALARELADGPQRDPARALTLADAAVAGARAEADPAALAYALFALGNVRWEPGTATERFDMAREMAAAASATGETELVLEAHLARVVAILELGDPTFSAELDAFVRLAEQAGLPRYLFLARSRQAMRACLTGPVEKADDLIEAAGSYGERIGEPDTWGVQASQLVGLALLRHDWTRLSVLAAARGRPLTPPEFSEAVRAWQLLEAGDAEAARSVVASMPDRPALYRWRHAALLTMEAELAAAVGDVLRCEQLYQRLLPMAGDFAVVGAAVFTTGPIALQLGLLAAALGRWPEAVAHLEDAVDRCDRLGATLLAGRAREQLARARAAVGGGRPDGSAPDAGHNSMRLDGDVWELSYAGHAVTVRDSKGLRDLAVLLGAPGREIPVTELVAGVPGTPAPLGSDAVLDDRARAAYRERLSGIDQELAEADDRQDIARSAQLAAERDALIDELARATGLGGRRRRLGDQNERARSTVTARIRDAIGRVERVHPDLGRHLRASVLTGGRCVYRPAETVRWAISRS